MNFLFLFVPIYWSTISACKRTANGSPRYASTVCAQKFGSRFLHKCSSEQIVHRNIHITNISVNHFCTNRQQTVDRNIHQPFLTSATFCCSLGALKKNLGAVQLKDDMMKLGLSEDKAASFSEKVMSSELARGRYNIALTNCSKLVKTAHLKKLFIETFDPC